jgi:hypothetical protein
MTPGQWMTLQMNSSKSVEPMRGYTSAFPSAKILRWSPCRHHLTCCHGSPGGLSRLPSRRRENTVPQEVDLGPPIGLPFEQFQRMDKALCRPITPDER